jgi:hypothetical protein
LLLSSCALFKPTADGKRDREEPERPEKKDLVYNPSTGEYEYVEDASRLVDTVQWQIDDNPPDPVTEEVLIPKKTAGSEIALLIPLNALENRIINDYLDSRTRRFVHFYAGAKLAISHLAEIGYPLTLKVFDTEGSEARVDQILMSRQLRTADLILGPYERELIDKVATFGDKNRIPVVSAWHPGSRSLAGHQYLVQATPGFYAHVNAIVDHIVQHYSDARVVIVGRNNPSEKARVELFYEVFLQANNKNMFGNQTLPDRLYISDESPDLAGTQLEAYLEKDRKTIFILPHYASDEESFVISFMRRLRVEKPGKEVVVFGLPQWTNYQKVNSDYLESLNVHISANHYINHADSVVHAFEREFLETYATLPEPSAFHGYDLVIYFGKLMAESGRAMLEYMPAVGEELLAYGFHIKPFPKDHSTSEPPPLLEYYENDHIMILKFKDHEFQKVR